LLGSRACALPTLLGLPSLARPRLPVTFAVRLTCHLTIPLYLTPAGLRPSRPTPSSRTHDRLGSSRVTPHLPGTAHPCPSRSAHAHSSAFPAMSLPLHRHVSAARHASSPRSHAPVRYAGARATLTCALRPYDTLALLGHLCSCASPRPYTHTQALRLLHIRPCLMTNALSRRLHPVTALGLFTSHLSQKQPSPPSFFSGQCRLVFVSTRGLHCACDATVPARLPRCLASRVLASPARVVPLSDFAPGLRHYRPCPSRSAPMCPPISLVAPASLLSARLPAACLCNAPPSWLSCPCAPGRMPQTLMFSSACATLPGFRACHLRVAPLARTLRPLISSVTRHFHQASTITPPSSAIMGHPSSNGRPLLLL
jgi:hypothetical protein